MAEDDDKRTILLVIIILGIMYTLLFVFSIARSWRTKDDPRFIQLFYIIVCIQILINAIIFWVLLGIKMSDVTIAIFSYIPSILMMLTYYMMFLLFMDQLISSRSPRSISFITKINRQRLLKFLIGLSAFFIFTFVILNIVFIIFSAFAGENNEYNDLFRYTFLISWTITIIWFLISVTSIYIKLSGIPYKSEKHKKNLTHVAIIFFLWSLAFILKLVLTVLQFESILSKNSTTMTQAILLIVVHVLTDIGPYISILEVKFIELFKQSKAKVLNLEDDGDDSLPSTQQILVQTTHNNMSFEEEFKNNNLGIQTVDFASSVAQSNKSLVNNIDVQRNTGIQSPIQKSYEDFRKANQAKSEFLVIPEGQMKQNVAIRQQSFRNSERQAIEKQLEVKQKEFSLLEMYNKPWYSSDKDKKTKLGVFQKATLKQQSVLCRVVSFERMTNYVLEDFFSELGWQKELKLKRSVVPVLGYHLRQTELLIFQAEMMSLFELLHSKEKEELRNSLDIKEKHEILLNLAKIMYTLHQFTPPICHGHLTSHNVFIDMQGGKSRTKVRIGDLELMPLLKYANTFYDYRSSSVWSAPECLQSMKKQLEPTPEMDVYSFGMLMWEFWHETIPFDNDLTLCSQYVVNEDSRPMIQTNRTSESSSIKLIIEEDIAKLIRLCWQSNPENRPKFSYICSILASLNLNQQ